MREADVQASLTHHIELIREHPLLSAVLSAVPSLVMIANARREIVYVNPAMLAFLGETADDVVGKTPGDVLGCLHATEDMGGCGLTPFCDYCGANQALQDSWEGTPAVQECHLTRSTETDPPALDLRVWTTPLIVGEEPFVFIAASDVSDERRRQSLERIFFHDILNTATIIDGSVKLWLSMDPEEDTTHVKSLLNQVTERLLDEIITQRNYVELENQQLTPKANHIEAREFLQGLVDSYLDHAATKGRDIRLEDGVPPQPLIIDKALLGRVLGNLLKNAVEATDDGQTIRLGYHPDGEDTVEFWVRNPTVMPEDVRLQVFKRGFSTKGNGRGLGTYSARILTERYLEGEISFTSEPGTGTVFRVRYPLRPSYATDED